MRRRGLNDLTEPGNDKAAKYWILVFLMANTLKITVFNLLLIGIYSLPVFSYKASITFLMVAIIYLMIFSIKSRFPYIIFYTVQTIYILINLAYFTYFRSYLHLAQAFILFSESSGAVRDWSILMNPKLLVPFLDLPVAIYIIVIYSRIIAMTNIKHRVQKWFLVFCSVLLIGAIEISNYVHHYSIVNIVKASSSTSELLVIERYGTFMDSLTDMVINKNVNNMISKLKYGKLISGKGTITGNSSKSNFVIIQVESMDSNAVNKQHNGQYVMPFLHSLAVQNVYYPYTLSYHEAGGTSDSEFSTLNSVEPLSDYPSIMINDYAYPNSLLKQLSQNSYSTIAFHGDTGSYYNRNEAYPKMGYQEFFDLIRMGLKQSGWGAPDEAVFNYSGTKLKDEKQPFFSYTITMSSHGPFTNVNNYYNNGNYDDVTDQTAKNYMKSMSYVDQALEDYINYIRANFNNTYVIIWGDHTPDINKSEYKQASFTEADRYFEFVPMIITTPDHKKYTEDKIAASFLDVAPTIINASGVPFFIHSDGMDLLNRTTVTNQIPYRGGVFDRSLLFAKVSQIK